MVKPIPRYRLLYTNQVWFWNWNNERTSTSTYGVDIASFNKDQEYDICFAKTLWGRDGWCCIIRSIVWELVESYTEKASDSTNYTESDVASVCIEWSWKHNVLIWRGWNVVLYIIYWKKRRKGNQLPRRKCRNGEKGWSVESREIGYVCFRIENVLIIIFIPLRVHVQCGLIRSILRKNDVYLVWICSIQASSDTTGILLNAVITDRWE